ncbi:hypothetical protein B0A49_12839, partial [Cryomyces minteri]
KETGEHIERWQFDVQIFGKGASSTSSKGTSTKTLDKENAAPDTTPAAPLTEAAIQSQISALFRQITASVTFLPTLDAGACTFNVLVYADADSDVPMEWGDSDAKEVVGGERVVLRGFSTNSHRVDTLVSYRLQD